MKQITIHDLAQKLGVHEATVRRWLNRVDAPVHTRTIGGHIRFHDPTAIESWIQGMRRGLPQKEAKS